MDGTERSATAPWIYEMANGLKKTLFPQQNDLLF
jgi:hypothetical protein